MAIEKFEVGKWYKWVGPKSRQPYWNSEGLMDGVLDGLPHQCQETGKYADSAIFDCTKREEGLEDVCWEWIRGMEYFEEVPDPNKEKIISVPMGEHPNTRDKKIRIRDWDSSLWDSRTKRLHAAIDSAPSIKKFPDGRYSEEIRKYYISNSLDDSCSAAVGDSWHSLAELLPHANLLGGTWASLKSKEEYKEFPFKTKKEKRRKNY